MDIISSYCFTTSFGAIHYPDFKHPLIITQRDTVETLWIQKHFPFLMRLPDLLPRWMVVRVIPGFAVFEEHKAAFKEQIEQYRLGTGANGEDMGTRTVFHYLLEQQQQAQDGAITDESLVEEAYTLIGAGSDTVANALTVGINAGLRDPEIKKRLVKELKNSWPDRNEKFEYTELEKLPYLTAFIKESLRCSYGVVSPLPRVVGPGDSKIAGFTVPSKTIVATSCAFLHQNPQAFENPTEFRPERWLQPDARDLESRYLVAFSRGIRMCLGLNLAWAELYLVLGNMFRKLDMTVVGGRDDDYIHYREVFVPLWKCQHLSIVATEARG
ncbi:hypothetical protein V5O48_008358 [Marasmius crinis-equi]|uniref:Cytochrome P450 n=1 Tax=Marasmius crinis-equi TaxID=585013 RepID=A0ABR3FEJ6_9AGAR